MRVIYAIVAGLLSAVAVTGTAAVPASAPTRPVSSAGSTVVVDCTLHPRVRPHEFLLACGDGSSALEGLRWSQWNATGAAGNGRHLLNDCTPTCVGGTWHAYPVTVTLQGSRPWSRHPDVQRYATLTLSYPSNRPPDTPRHVTYTLWD